MEDYLGKNFFWWLDLLFSGWKNEHFFDWFQSKVKNYLLIQKDNSFDIFYATKEGTFFSGNCHFLITGRVVLHKKFYKKFHLPVIKNGRLFRQKNFFLWLDLLFSGWKNEHFSIDFNRKWRIIFLIQKDNSLTFFMRQRRERFFQNLSLFDNWSCSTTQEIL